MKRYTNSATVCCTRKEKPALSVVMNHFTIERAAAILTDPDAGILVDNVERIVSMRHWTPPRYQAGNGAICLSPRLASED
jgi:hypothetical protein